MGHGPSELLPRMCSASARARPIGLGEMPRSPCPATMEASRDPLGWTPSKREEGRPSIDGIIRASQPRVTPHQWNLLHIPCKWTRTDLSHWRNKMSKKVLLMTSLDWIRGCPFGMSNRMCLKSLAFHGQVLFFTSRCRPESEPECLRAFLLHKCTNRPLLHLAPMTPHESS